MNELPTDPTKRKFTIKFQRGEGPDRHSHGGRNNRRSRRKMRERRQAAKARAAQSSQVETIEAKLGITDFEVLSTEPGHDF